MQHFPYGLVALRIRKGYFKPTVPVQESLSRFCAEVRFSFNGSRSSKGLLPFPIWMTWLDADRKDLQTIVLQVVDSSTVYVGREPFAVPHAGRHLTSLEVMVWGSKLSPYEFLNSSQETLELITVYRAMMILNKSFEMTSFFNGKHHYLGLVMTVRQYEQLQCDTYVIESMMYREQDESFELAYGLTPETAKQKMKAVDKAHNQNFMTFSSLERVDIEMAEIEHADDAMPFCKDQPFTGYPSSLNFRQEIGKGRLRDYLKAP